MDVACTRVSDVLSTLSASASRGSRNTLILTNSQPMSNAMPTARTLPSSKPCSIAALMVIRKLFRSHATSGSQRRPVLVTATLVVVRVMSALYKNPSRYKRGCTSRGCRSRASSTRPCDLTYDLARLRSDTVLVVGTPCCGIFAYIDRLSMEHPPSNLRLIRRLEMGQPSP